MLQKTQGIKIFMHFQLSKALALKLSACFGAVLTFL